MATLKRVAELDGGNIIKRPKLNVESCRKWTIEDVVNFLSENGLDEVVPTFISEEITGDVLSQLTEERLEKMGIETMGQRLRILGLLEPLRPSSCSVPPIPFAKLLENFKVFNDPIHGHIELHPLCMALVDTPQFQRLRYIKQLGGCYYVFPGATNNRFEHSIGVCHLAGQLARVLQSRQPELGVSETDILCVEIAGLCHDLGHGPFSHMFDGKFIPAVRPDYQWRHEEASVKMFDHLVETNKLKDTFAKYGLTERDRTFIKEQIAGPRIDNAKEKWQYQGREEDKSFLYEIVANKRNGIDVDKWDYFARDCHSLGIKNNFDHLRFMKFVRVLSVCGQMQICSRDKEVGNLYDMFHTRTVLHRRAYQHKIGNIVENMITEALVKANEHIKFQGKDGTMLKLSDCIDDMYAYTQVNDYVYHRILQSRSPELAEARGILENIERRNLYKCVGQSKPQPGKLLPQSDVGKMQEEIVRAISEEELEGPQLQPQHIIVHLIKYDYGMKDKNPIDHVRFYLKGNPTQAIRVRKDQVSEMLPENFLEQHIRVYVKKTDAYSIEVATRCFHRWCKNKKLMTPKGGDVMDMSMTPFKLSQNEASSSVEEEELAVPHRGALSHLPSFNQTRVKLAF